jgi:ribulose-bisphosphate carboxylase large chain
MNAPLHVTYRLRPGGDAEQRAAALALEQSIEMPLAAVTDSRVLTEVVARVEHLGPQPDGSTLARLALSAESVGDDAGQLMNMLFGNSSLLGDVEVEDVTLPADLVAMFGGPALGIAGLRRLTGVQQRALTCTALKPIGSEVSDLSRLTAAFASAGIDVIKDDHGWAAGGRTPFEERVIACQREVEQANRGRSSHTLYAPALSGDAAAMRKQLRFAQSHGIAAVLIAPMIAGVSNFNALRREFPTIAFIAHPALAGRQIAPVALLGRLFRVFGADAVIFPNHGGRFSYSRATCDGIAARLRERLASLRPAMPVPAGGMSVERVPEIVANYGLDTMLLIGGNLLLARERLAERSAEFVQAVAAASEVIA